MKTVTCQACLLTADVPKEEGLQPDLPPGWGTTQLTQRGRETVSRIVCSSCIVDVRAAIGA